MELEERIPLIKIKYISTFKPNFVCKRPYLNLVRGILRKQKYKFEANDYLVKLDNGFLKRTTKYKIFRDK